ncbi:PDZ domain-containing protein [Candidatus Woesearchaeota archaeon]|nr:PDZ domain-containing protein [Candidatus Woesearchaeota archaeon]
MKNKLMRIIRDKRVIALIIAIAVALIAINPNPWRDGVTAKSVERDSPASLAGVKAGEHIISVNSREVKDTESFAELTSNLAANETIFIETEKAFYKLTVLFDEQNQSADLGIEVAERPKTNIRTGLDLQGGTRVLLRPAEKISETDLELLIENMNKRLNVFGLSDVVVRDASDISGQQYIMVEVAGVNEEEVKELISAQGKFEATVGNESVFRGSDVVDVCRSAQCSGIDYYGGGCQQLSPSEWACPFYFSITLSHEAAQRQAEATKNLPVTDGYLSEKLLLYLDDELVDELNIAESLKGQPSVSVQISGSGSGATQNTASKEAIKNMKQLQTILITGSLPVKLEVAQTDVVSPVLGEEFVRNALLTGLVAMLAVSIVLFAVYRKIAIALPMMLTSIVEVFLLLGVASLIKWNMDLAAIAGIIAAVGTGVNDQIIITNEALSGENRAKSWKEKTKGAFSVIFGAYFTLLVAMIPLFIIGAGLLRGFAVTTIIGITVGVLITRPAYAKIIEILID